MKAEITYFSNLKSLGTHWGHIFLYLQSKSDEIFKNYDFYRPIETRISQNVSPNVSDLKNMIFQLSLEKIKVVRLFDQILHSHECS